MAASWSLQEKANFAHVAPQRARGEADPSAQSAPLPASASPEPVTLLGLKELLFCGLY